MDAALYVRDITSPIGVSMAANTGVTTSSSLDSGDTKSQESSKLPELKPAGLEEGNSDSPEEDDPDDDGLDLQHQPQLQHLIPSSSQQPLLAAPDPAPNSLQAEWTSQEQLRLVEILSRYPADKHTALERYLHAAAALPNKSTRDVAHRVHSLQQLSLDGRNRAPTAEELRIRAAQQSVVTASRQPSLPTPFSRLAINRPPTPPIIPLNIRRPPTSVLPALPPGGLLPAARLNSIPAPGSARRSSDPTISSSAAGSASSESADVAAAISTALDSNYVLLQSIKENMIAFNVSDNTDLLVRFRDNLLIAQLHLNSATGVLGSMPQLPVSINLDLAARFLPAASNNGGLRAMSSQQLIPPPLHIPTQLIPPATSPAPDINTVMANSVPVIMPTSIPTTMPSSMPTSMPVNMPVPSFLHAGSAPSGILASGLAGIAMPGAQIPMLSHSFPYTMPGAFTGLAGLPLTMPASTIPTLPAGFPTMENFFTAALSATGVTPGGSLPAFTSPFNFPLGMGMPMMPQAAALAMQARLMMAQGLGGLSSLGMLQSATDASTSAALTQQQAIPISDALRTQQLQAQALLQHAALQQQHAALQQLPRQLPPHLAMSPQLLQHQQQQLQQLQQQQQQPHPHVALQASWMANPSGGAPLPVFAAPQMLNAGLMLPLPPQAAPYTVPPAVKVEVVPVPPSAVPVPLSMMGLLAPKGAPLVVKQEVPG